MQSGPPTSEWAEALVASSPTLLRLKAVVPLIGCPRRLLLRPEGSLEPHPGNFYDAPVIFDAR